MTVLAADIRATATAPAAWPVELDEAIPASKLAAIAKATRVLRALAGGREDGSGVTDLALAADLPKSTTHRVLAELIAEGFVSHHDQLYRLGPVWFSVQETNRSSEWSLLVEQARVPLGLLFERTGATVHFGVLDGTQVLYLEKLTARGGTSVPTRVGKHMPATCTALGKALLAHAPRDVCQGLLTQPLPRLTGRSIALPRLLAGQLEETRRSGVARDLEESQAGVRCAAAPVVLRNGVAVAAVSITRVGCHELPASDVDEVRAAARRVSEWLSSGTSRSVAAAAGYSGPPFRAPRYRNPGSGRELPLRERSAR